MISWLVSSSPASGSVPTARSPEPASDSVSPSLSAPPPLTLCLSKINKQTLKKRIHHQMLKAVSLGVEGASCFPGDGREGTSRDVDTARVDGPHPVTFRTWSAEQGLRAGPQEQKEPQETSILAGHLQDQEEGLPGGGPRAVGAGPRRGGLWGRSHRGRALGRGHRGRAVGAEPEREGRGGGATGGGPWGRGHGEGGP